MLASDIISRVEIVLNDVGGVRWTQAELLKWISDGQRAIVVVRPDASSQNVPFECAAGTKQDLPSDANRLLDVIRNKKPNGDPGRVIRMIERSILDLQNPNWHSTTASGTIYNAMQDNRDPKTFYVYPPAVAGTEIEILYSQIPAELSAPEEELTVNDLYADPLTNYVLFRAYSKDSEVAINAGLAQSYMQIFMSMLGIKTTKDFAFSPDANNPGIIPNVTAVQAGGV